MAASAASSASADSVASSMDSSDEETMRQEIALAEMKLHLRKKDEGSRRCADCVSNFCNANEVYLFGSSYALYVYHVYGYQTPSRRVASQRLLNTS